MKSNLLSFVFLLSLMTNLIAATSGKIAGTVKDAETNDPLPGVNVVLEGTTMGAATNVNGEYVILNVPPGTYTLRAQMIGYTAVRVQDVRVSIDLTTTQNFELSPTVLEAGEEITIVAERPLVLKDQTSTTAVVDADAFQALPVTEVSEAIELQAGLVRDAGGGLHVRGGRSGEVSYWIDGIPVTDSYDGSQVVEVNKNMVQELQVVSGAFNAEYGQAMSGIVNIATKDGSNNFGGAISTYIGDHFSTHDNIFTHIDNINPVSIRNIDGSIQGPLIKDKLYYYVNARYIHFTGQHYGQRLYNPNAIVTSVDGLSREALEQVAPEYLSRARQNDQGLYGFPYVLGTNAFIDSIITQQNLPPDAEGVEGAFEDYYNRLRSAHQGGFGDGEYVPMQWNRKIYTQAKLIWRALPSIKLSYNFIYDDVDYQDYDRAFQYNPDGILNQFRTGYTHILQMTHTLSGRTFYNLGISLFNKTYENYLYEDPHDPRYVHPDVLIQNPYSFKTGGTSNGRFQRKTNTMLVKFDLTSQVTNNHQIKAGFDVRYHNMYQRDVQLRPIETQTQKNLLFESPYIQTRILPDSTIYASQYKHNPLQFSAYIQDKMEYESMIVNVGVRFDYFEPDGVILSDPSDPTITNPLRPENRFRDIGSDGIPNSFDPDGTEGNGIWDPGEPAVTLEDRRDYWYLDAEPKYSISPRLGISFPITDRGVIYFSYGHFYQIPRFELLYQNPDFELGAGTGNVGVIGNADLKPEQTISAEIGLNQQLGENFSVGLTGYFRDIRNLTGTRADEILLYGGSARYSKLVNSDFGFVKGVVFSATQRFQGGFSGSLDYTYQTAKGSASDPEQTRNAIAGGAQPEVQLTSLDWDQRHTINATVSYAGNKWGGSLIGQWGSGLPYTPRNSTDITSLLTNSRWKTSFYNVDLRAYREFDMGFGRMQVFARVLNLLDTLNEINVYNDTGRAGYTTDQKTAESSNPPEIINSLEDWFTNATHYSEPRRLELGLQIEF